jgi:putative PEP-CTERM system TPR-repeat lipoprotein
MAQAGEDKAAKYYEDALARFEANDTAAAIVQLKNALQQDPKMIAAHVLLGKAYLRTGDPDAAADVLAKALQLGVSRSEVAVPLAQALYAQGKYRELLEGVTPDMAGTSAQRTELLVLRGHAHKLLGEFELAGQSYQQARTADPHYIPAILSHADLFAEAGKRSDADRLIEQALAIAPTDPAVWNRKASIAQGYGDVAAAMAAYDKTLSIEPRFIEARIGRAGLFVDLDRLAQADVDLEYLSRAAPDEPRALYLKGVVLSRRGDSAAAREALLQTTRLLDAVPPEILRARIPQGLLLGGLSHYGLNEMEKAAAYLSAFIATNPRHPGSRKLLGSIFLTRGDHREAISVLEPARRAAPNDPDTLALLAAAYVGRGQYQTASQLLDQALQASSSAPRIQAKLGLSLITAGQQKLGMEHLQRSFTNDPSQTQVGLALAVIYLKQGDDKAAVEVAEKAAARQPKSAIAQNTLGVARQAAGDRAGARGAYRRALEIDKSLLPAELNLARLDLADGNASAARARLQGILKARPNSSQPMLELASVEEVAGNPGEALRWLEKLHAMDRRNVLATARLVDLLIRTGKPDKALEVAKETVAVAPEDLTALTAVGQSHVALADYKQAQVAFGRMTRLAAFNPAWQYRIAQFQLSANNPEGAIFSLERVLANQPDHLPAQVLLTEVELQRGDVGKAVQRARSIAANAPTQGIGERLLGDIALAQGKAGDAIKHYQAALRLQPDIEVALRLYRAYFAAGQDRAALAFLESWGANNRQDALAARALAEGYLRAGDLAAARSRYEALLKAEPNDAQLVNNLAHILARQGDGKALEYAERAHRLAPQDAGIQDTLGWLLVRGGQVEAGLRHLREARLRAPGNPAIRYHLAAALAEVGRAHEARAELDEALKTTVAFDDLEAARSLRQRLAPR